MSHGGPSGIDLNDPAHQAVGLALRESGLIVPNHLAAVPDPTAQNPKHRTVARDMDGRRRLVFTDEQRRSLNRLLVDLAKEGLGVVVGCVQQVGHRDGGKACGALLLAEGVGTADPGFGCRCTRIHWAKP